jgi:hypothetical protein
MAGKLEEIQIENISETQISETDKKPYLHP